MTSKSATPQRLYLIEVATAAWSKAGMPIVCYLVQTSDGKNILIDSGLPENFVPLLDCQRRNMAKMSWNNWPCSGCSQAISID